MMLLLESLAVLVKVLYYWLEAVVLFFVPASVRGKNVAGETVLITGAGSGIGRLLARRFAALGCRLVLWDVSQEGLQLTAREVREQDSSVWTYVVDLVSQEQIAEAAERVQREVGHVDILVNNAGVVSGKTFLDCPNDLIERTLRVNTLAHFWTLKCFLPAMLERDHGHVVTVASSAGLVGVSGLVDYCSSKFAVVGLDESLRLELDHLGKRGVYTTVVCPYIISTGMFEGCRIKFPWLANILEPAEVADRIIEAVLCNQAVLVQPRLLYLVAALKGILPVKCSLILSSFLGPSSMMDTFKGRAAAHAQSDARH